MGAPQLLGCVDLDRRWSSSTWTYPNAGKISTSYCTLAPLQLPKNRFDGHSPLPNNIPSIFSPNFIHYGMEGRYGKQTHRNIVDHDLHCSGLSPMLFRISKSTKYNSHWEHIHEMFTMELPKLALQ